MLKQVNRNSAGTLERSGMIRTADPLGGHFSGVALSIKRLLAHTQVVENLVRKIGNSLKKDTAFRQCIYSSYHISNNHFKCCFKAQFRWQTYRPAGLLGRVSSHPASFWFASQIYSNSDQAVQQNDHKYSFLASSHSDHGALVIGQG